MGQVPVEQNPYRYLLVGSGRLANHLNHYLQSQGLTFYRWSRRDGSFEDLRTFANESNFVLLAISDQALRSFVQEHTFLSEKILVHFSGAQSIPGMSSIHPLTTFGPQLYEPEQYQEIPFIAETGKLSFHDIFPQLNNPHFQISPEQKTYYHALCVASGNFTQLLWMWIWERFEILGLPPEQCLSVYMKDCFANSLYDPKNALTGPFVRNDVETVNNHLRELEDDPLGKIYESFWKAYQNHEEPSSHKKTQGEKDL